MRKFLLACLALIASCSFGEIEVVPEATKLSIQNNSDVQLSSVVWKNTEFKDIGFGRISMREVSDGYGFIFFNVKDKPYRTRLPVICNKHRHEQFLFANSTSIIDMNDDNMITLGSLNAN